MICTSDEHGGPHCIKKAAKRITVSKGDDSNIYLLCSKHSTETQKELQAEGIKKQGFKIWVQSL